MTGRSTAGGASLCSCLGRPPGFAGHVPSPDAADGQQVGAGNHCQADAQKTQQSPTRRGEGGEHGPGRRQLGGNGWPLPADDCFSQDHPGHEGEGGNGHCLKRRVFPEGDGVGDAGCGEGRCGGHHEQPDQLWHRDPAEQGRQSKDRNSRQQHQQHP